MKQLNHTNIVGFIDYVVSTNNIYIITEYCNGSDLKQFLKENHPLTEEIAIKIIKSITKGLQFIIKKNFIHRDLKPANILFHNQISKIADFGFSRKINPIMASIVGTPMYMAPQVLQRQHYTSKCDIWSLGVIYYEMLFGVTPWVATDILDLMQKYQYCELTIPKNTKFSQESISFLQGCLEKQEKNRFDWSDIFDHPLIKPRLNLQINSCLNDDTHSQNSFYNNAKLYYINKTQRDRSASNKIIEPLKSNESTESQSKIYGKCNPTISRCVEIAKLLRHKDLEKIKRANSKFEIVKPCQQYTQKANSQHNISGNQCKSTTQQDKQNLEKKLFKKKNGVSNLVSIITTLEEEACRKGYSELINICANQKQKILSNQMNYKIEINKIKVFMEQKIDSSIKSKLDFYIKLLKLCRVDKENDYHKLIYYNSK